MDRGAWWATVHGVAKSWDDTEQLSMHAYTSRNDNVTSVSGGEGARVPQVSLGSESLDRRKSRCGHPEVGVSVGFTGPYGAHISVAVSKEAGGGVGCQRGPGSGGGHC